MLLLEDIIYCSNKKSINPNAKKLLETKYPNLLTALIEKTNHLPTDSSISERLYNFSNKITQIKRCPVCDKKIEFKNHTYSNTCSYKCLKQYEKITIDAKTGKTLDALRNEKVKLSNKKIGDDGLSSYSRGIKQVWQNIKQKENSTEIISEMRRKTRQTKIDNGTFYDERIKATKTRKTKSIQKIDSSKFQLLNAEEFLNEFNKDIRLLCNTCHIEFKISSASSDIICPNCFPKARSKVEAIILQFLRECNIKYEINKKKILDNKLELDIFCPEFKLAIEVNGDYYHSEKFISSNYHINKYIACKDKNIKLLQFFETEIKHKFDIVKNIINHNIKRNQEKYDARKCCISSVDSNTAKEFFEKTHIQGFLPSKYYLALKYKDEIIQMMSFRKSRFNKKYDWEIIRNSSKLGCTVRGGTSKLISYFIKNISSSLITYADLRYGNGDSYLYAGGKYLSTSPPNYWYIWNKKLYTRYQFQKQNMIKLFGNKFDPDKTEIENAQANGALRTWDSGNNVFYFDDILNK